MNLKVLVTLLLLCMVVPLRGVGAAQVSARSEPLRLIPPIGHTRNVTDIQSSRDGRFAASISDDGSAVLWETATARVIRRFPLAGKGRQVRFVENDRALVTTEHTGRVVLWDSETGVPRWSVKAPLRIESLSVRPDGREIAVSGTVPPADEDAVTVLYRADTGAELRTFGAASEMGRAGITDVLFSPDGTALYGFSRAKFQAYREQGMAPNPLLAFDAETGKQAAAFTATGAPVSFSGNGKFLLTQGKADAVWRDARTGFEIRTFRREMQGEAEPQKMALSPDNTRFATVTNGGGYGPGGTIREYSVATGEIVHKVEMSGVGPDNCLIYLPDARDPSADNGVLVTLNASQQPFCRVILANSGIPQVFRGGSGTFCTAAALSPDGRTVFLRNGGQTGIVSWDATNRAARYLYTFPSDTKGKDTSPPLARPVVSRDGSLLVTPGVSNEHVFVSDLRTGIVIADIRITINALSEGIALHPRGEWVAISAGDTNYRDSVKLFSPKGGLLREIQPPAVGNRPLFIRAVASDATGERVLISDYDGRLFVYAVKTGNLERTFPSAAASAQEAIAFVAPLGDDADRVLVVRDSGQASELDLATSAASPVDFGDPVEGRSVGAVSRNGEWASVGRADGSIVLRQRSTKSITTLIGHTGRLYDLAFSPDGRRLTSLGSDGLIRFWDTATGKEQAALLVYTRKPSTIATYLLDSALAERETRIGNVPEWIVFNRSGYFEGSEAATGQVHFAKGTQTLSADQLFEQFYRSGLLASVMTNTNTPSVPPQSIFDSLRLGAPPLVQIVAPIADGAASSSAAVTITVNATEQTGGGVKAIRLYQNGRLIGGPTALRGIVVEAARGATTTKTFTVALTAGENTFRAVAYSKSDLESVPASLTVAYTPPKINKPNLFVLAVGINTYKDSTMNLSYARPDAEALAQFFTLPGGKTASLFGSVTVSHLLDEQATGAAIRNGLYAIATAAKPEDVVFLYFAGHGETADGAWYFLPHEMRQMALSERVKEYGIPWSSIEAAVGKIPARKVVLVVDACKSGAALEGAVRGGDTEQQAMAIMARAQGIHILTAATGQQYAAEVKELGHGILTYALLEGLNGKAAGVSTTAAPPTVFVRDLMSYIENRVPDLSKKYRGSEQYPVPFERGQNFPLVIK